MLITKLNALNFISKILAKFHLDYDRVRLFLATKLDIISMLWVWEDIWNKNLILKSNIQVILNGYKIY